MASSLSYRVLLMGLLPVIALCMYLEGQSYDPALIQFQSMVSGVNPMEAFFPEGIDSLRRNGTIISYMKDNLHEYVNGHAEYFISAGFAALSVGEYGKAGSDRDEPGVIVDIYDMGKSLQAFGILSDESGGSSHQLSTGAQGFRTRQGISFVRGQYYVRITAFDDTVSLDMVSETIDRRIGTGSDPFPEFSRFPDMGKVLQTRFVREAYRGLDFVNNVIEREYLLNGEKLQISLFTGKEGDAGRLVEAYMEFFRQNEIEYTGIEKMGTTFYEVDDPYEGKWVLIPQSESLFGIYGLYNEELLNKIISGAKD